MPHGMPTPKTNGQYKGKDQRKGSKYLPSNMLPFTSITPLDNYVMISFQGISRASRRASLQKAPKPC